MYQKINSEQENFDENGIKIKLSYSHDFDSYNTFEYNYYDLDSFLKALIRLPINKQVFSYPSSIYKSYSFTGTYSFEEAWNLCRFGMDKGYQSFVNGLNYLNFKQSEFEKKKNSYRCIGYVPNVVRFLNGNPNNMKIKKNQIVRSAITINMQISYSAFTKKEAVINRGICVLNLINYLERRGFDCILQLEEISICKSEMIRIVVPIKRNDEKLNVKLSYFPLVHPSFLRRLIFRAEEIIPGIDMEWGDGYGYPYKKNDFEIMKMENTVYISTPAEMGIQGDNLDQDFEAFVSYIDEKYHIYDYERKDEEWQKTYGIKY